MNLLASDWEDIAFQLPALAIFVIFAVTVWRLMDRAADRCERRIVEVIDRSEQRLVTVTERSAVALDRNSSAIAELQTQLMRGSQSSRT